MAASQYGGLVPSADDESDGDEHHGHGGQPDPFGHDAVGIPAVDEGIHDGRDDGDEVEPEVQLLDASVAACRNPDVGQIDQARNDCEDQPDRIQPGGRFDPQHIGIADIDRVEDQRCDEEAEGYGVE